MRKVWYASGHDPVDGGVMVQNGASLLVRALAAFLLLPGTVAYLVPVLLAPVRSGREAWQWAGFVLIVAGTFLLVWCARDFYVAGKGTLAPWSPPRRLVETGLYRWSRNPMYVAVALVLVGWSVWYASIGLVTYAFAVIAAFHLRVILYEEPRLAATFGVAWPRYRDRVRRWL